MWTCEKCGTDVHESLPVCWGCRAPRAGHVEPAAPATPPPIPEPVPAAEPEPELEPEPEPEPPAPAYAPETCAKCGSDRIIPNAKVLDTGDWSAGYARATVERAPNAYVFKDAEDSRLVIHICGACGFSELAVSDPQTLWEHYSRGR